MAFSVRPRVLARLDLISSSRPGSLGIVGFLRTCGTRVARRGLVAAFLAHVVDSSMAKSEVAVSAER
jgi:hypothetical protein